MLPRSPLAATTALSLALHLGLLLWIPRAWMKAAGEGGREKLVVSFGTIELPMVSVAEPAERPSVVEPLPVEPIEVPADLEAPEHPEPDPGEDIEAPFPVEELRLPPEPPVLDPVPLTDDMFAPVLRTPSAPRGASANEDPGTPERTEGSASDLRAAFIREVLARIEKAKRYPREARRRGINGTARVAFALSSEGRVLSAKLVSSSGHASLDQETVAMIRRAAPYPRIPDELEVRELRLTLPVVFRLEKGEINR